MRSRACSRAERSGRTSLPCTDHLEKNRDLCHLVAALDYKRFAGADAFLNVITTMISEIHQAPAAEGFDRVLAPGEPEHLKEQDRTTNGIPLGDYIWDDLGKLTRSMPWGIK